MPDHAGCEGARTAANASFWLRRERVRNAEITAQALPHLLGFKDQAVAATCLPRCVCSGHSSRRHRQEWPRGANSCSTFRPHRHTKKGRRSAKVPRYPGDREHLTIKSDRRVVPVLGLDACAKKLVACVQPISLSFADVRCLAQVTDVDASCLFDGSSAISASSRHRSPMTDARIEAFLADVIAVEGENPDAIQDGVHVALADSEQILKLRK